MRNERFGATLVAWRVVLRFGAIGLACAGSSGCLFDSSYWQQKAAQRNVAQQQTPRALEATPAAASDSKVRSKVLRVRVHATPGHAAEVVEWPKQFAHLVDDANRILEPTLHARFEIVESRVWNTQLSSDSLDPLLTALRAVDKGDDVDCIVGLVGSLPIFARSFHQLGLGQVGGKYLTLRAMNDAREREAFEIELARLGDDEREKLYQTRKRHKATTVFLHEVGHTFGLIHELDATSIMNTHYDKAMTAFSPASAEIMRTTIEHRTKEPKTADERAFTARLLEQFENERAGWVAAERDAMVASLKARLAMPAAAAAPTGQPPGTAPFDERALKDVAPGDRAILSQAAEQDGAGRPGDAWTKAEELFARYPDVYAVQDFRCKLALKLSSDFQIARRECERLMEMTRGKNPKSK